MIRTFDRMEVWLLVSFLIFLPVAEAPKNIALYLFLSYWIVRSTRYRNWGNGCPWLEWPLIIVGTLSLVAIPFQDGGYLSILGKTIDFLSIAALFLTVARTSVSAEVARRLGFAVLIGLAAGLMEGLARWSHFPALSSVGHINQVAMYMGVAASGVLAFVALSANRVSLVSYTFAFSSILLAMIATGSRNALFGVALVCSATIVFLFLYGHRVRGLVGTVIFIGVVGSLSFFAPPSALERQASILSSTSHVVDDARLRIWNGALVMLQEKPLLGHGVGQFGSATSLMKIEEARSRRELPFEESSFFQTTHAHNLWFNWAVERGLPATGLFSAWLIVALCRLNWRSGALIGGSDVDGQAVFRLAATLVVLSTILFGIGNTSWHHEHGMLAAVIIAIAFSLQHRSTREPVASSTPPASPA